MFRSESRQSWDWAVIKIDVITLCCCCSCFTTEDVGRLFRQCNQIKERRHNSMPYNVWDYPVFEDCGVSSGKQLLLAAVLNFLAVSAWNCLFCNTVDHSLSLTFSHENSPELHHEEVERDPTHRTPWSQPVLIYCIITRSNERSSDLLRNNHALSRYQPLPRHNSPLLLPLETWGMNCQVSIINKCEGSCISCENNKNACLVLRVVTKRKQQIVKSRGVACVASNWHVLLQDINKTDITWDSWFERNPKLMQNFIHLFTHNTDIRFINEKQTYKLVSKAYTYR